MDVLPSSLACLHSALCLLLVFRGTVRAQLNARVKQLELKYGIDKVQVTGYDRVDTTPQAAHNTSYCPPRPAKAF